MRAFHFLASILAAAMLAFAAAGVQSASFDPEGKYELVKPPQPTDTPGKVEVVDVFWYGCPHCFRFLPVMEEFEKSKPEYVEIRRMPAIFRDSWVAHARAYYTARLLGIAEQVHRPIFDAIHVEGRALDTEESLMKFFEDFGVSNEEFRQTYASFAVDSLVRKSRVMQQRYGVRGTPSVIVNGKYRVSGSLAGSFENMVKVIAALAEREHESQVAAR